MYDQKLADSLIERARALKPTLAERASGVEEARIVGQNTITEFQQAGFFKILQPGAYGGYELPSQVLTEIIFEVASACGSSGWVLAVLGLHQWEVQLLPGEAQAEIWGEDSDALLCSAYAPTGEVVPTEGGFRLSGEWPFSSGCDHARWAIVGGIRPPTGADGIPMHCGFFVPRSAYDIVDDWDTLGLRGTGSKRLVMKDVFVPEHRHHPIFGAAPKPPEGAAPTYKIPFGMIFGEMLAAAAHGMAQGVLQQFIERNKTRVATLDRSKCSENPDIHRHIAETDYIVRTARALSNSNQTAAYMAACDNRELSTLAKARHFWEMAKSVHDCSDAASRLYAISGAHAILAGDPLQRALRDLQSATTHMAFSLDTYARNYGAMHMGQANSLGLI